MLAINRIRYFLLDVIHFSNTKWKIILDWNTLTCKKHFPPNRKCRTTLLLFRYFPNLCICTKAQTDYLNLLVIWMNTVFFKLYRYDLAEVMTINTHTQPTFLEFLSLINKRWFSGVATSFSNKSISNADRCSFDMDEWRYVFIKLS